MNIKAPLLAVFLSTTAAFGQTNFISFESLPDGSLPFEGMAISNQFLQRFGVTFSFVDGTFPHIAEVGVPATAFWGQNPMSGPDQPRPNQNVGRFFLTDDGTPGGSPFVATNLLITYAQPVGAASGVLLDVDVSDDLAEHWTVEARNGETQIVASVFVQTGVNYAGDGLAAPWSFARSNADIHSIVIRWSGAGRSPGLAFDNFSPSLPVSPPALSMSFTQGVPRLAVSGLMFSRCRVEYALSLLSSNWQTLTTIVFSNAPQQFFLDYTASNTPSRFYRGVGL